MAGKRSRIPGACATRNFTYMVRGPCHLNVKEWWWRHAMETFLALLALGEENPPVTGGRSWWICKQYWTKSQNHHWIFWKYFRQDSVTDIPDIKPQKLKTYIDITEIKSAIMKLKTTKALDVTMYKQNWLNRVRIIFINILRIFLIKWLKPSNTNKRSN